MVNGKENMESKVINAFQSNETYFEMMREHNVKRGLNDVNIETDVKSLILNNLNGYILDAGAGEGSIGLWMAKNNPNVKIAALDISPIGVKKGRVLSNELNINNTNFLIGDIRKIPFSNNSFNLIVCQSVLEHVIGVFDVLKEFHRILKKGGKLIIRVGNSESLLHFSFLGWFFKKSKEDTKNPSLTLRPGSFDNHRENFDTCSIPSYVLVNQLKKVGFSVQFYTTFPQHVLLRDFKELTFSKRIVMKLLLKIHKFPPISHIGGTTIVMVRK
jgi:ubiquinone/menaquinone biosynthesis C-methylase UbiE